MKKSVLIKMSAIAIFLFIGLFGFSVINKSETQTFKPSKTPEEIVSASAEIANYKNWTKVNEKPELVFSRIAAMCARPITKQMDEEAKNPHNDKYINVFVNEIGKAEMMTKKHPKFPVGTVIVKEKMSTADSKEPELLTVMIKREKDYNPKIGDWEFLTFDGSGAKTTARGKLENCQVCR